MSRVTWREQCTRDGIRFVCSIDGTVAATVAQSAEFPGGWYWYGWGVTAKACVHATPRDARQAARAYWESTIKGIK